MMLPERLPVPVTLLAALFLVVQAFLSGSWIGFQASAAQFDAFGNIICTSHAGDHSKGGQQKDDYDSGCCLFGCDSGAAVLPEAGEIGQERLAFAITSDGKPASKAAIRRQELQPLSSRGPPA
ncbi:hypothetical protein ABID26_004558 [Mesorhizobium shonense]|uniref:DUF2946 domain-containing protein n=1 Tax=Mesorhizobium shonense TaxID=1209948 RepID=A0ABV2HX23_9HYPH